MKWSLRIARVAGINLYVHATFLLIIVWVAVVSYAQARSASATVEAVAFVLALFGCIVLHELGHALAARRYGIATRDITLLPIGGLARLERMPREPRQEMVVALAGPAVNFVLAGIIGIALAAFDALPTAEEAAGGLSFLARLMAVNVFLALFNLLPAFPMDGGRVLRALLATRMGPLRATQAAATVGQAMAFFFGFVGLFTNPFLVFIALFVWMGATQEAGLAEAEALLAHVPVRRVMVEDAPSLAHDSTLGEAVELTLRHSQHDFAVLEGEKVVGILTQGALLSALSEHGRQHPVAAVMDREFDTATASEDLETAFKRLQSCRCSTLPVLAGGRLAGLLTRDNIRAFLSIQNALAEARAQRESGRPQWAAPVETDSETPPLRDRPAVRPS